MSRKVGPDVVVTGKEEAEPLAVCDEFGRAVKALPYDSFQRGPLVFAL